MTQHEYCLVAYWERTGERLKRSPAESVQAAHGEHVRAMAALKDYLAEHRSIDDWRARRRWKLSRSRQPKAYPIIELDN